jgi:hypothetical protein
MKNIGLPLWLLLFVLGILVGGIITYKYLCPEIGCHRLECYKDYKGDMRCGCTDWEVKK